MRLVEKGKYQSAKSDNRIVFCFSLIFFLLGLNSQAQTYRLNFHEITLSEALLKVSEQFDIKVAFDAERLSSVMINREVTGDSVDGLISDLLLSSGFDYKYRYNRYLIVEKKTKDAPVKPSFNCQIVGSVSDKETGENLPYASVLLYDQDILASASENGSFSIRDISANPVHISVSYIGYLPLDTTITWKEPTVNLEFMMRRKVHILDTIVVKGEKLEMIDLRNDVDFAATIDPTRLNDLPLLAETDIFRMLQLLPGISYSENSSGLSIRGGLSDQNLILFDGQTLYNLSHYYGVISAINPNVVKDMQIYRGGFDSRYGERVSGIVDITGKSGNYLKPVVYGDLNLLSGNVTAEIPLNNKLTFIGAVRRSYSDIYSTGFSDGLFERKMNWFRGDSTNIVNQTKPAFYFYDYNAKMTFRPSNLESISIGCYGGKDFYENTYSGTSRNLRVDGTDRNAWSNYGISANWLRQWDGSLFSNVQAGASGYLNNSTNQTIIDGSQSTGTDKPFLTDSVYSFNTFNKNELKDIFFSARNTLKISNNNQLNFGLLTRLNKIYYHKDAETVYVYDNTNQTGWTYSAYFQDRITLKEKLTLKPGARMSYYNGSGKMYFEPRFSANYRFSGNFSLRIATGRYYQFINQVLAQQETGYNRNFWVLANGVTHPVVTSDHYIIGLTAEKGKILFDAEAYYKSFAGLQEYVYVSQFLRESEFPDLFPGKQPGIQPDPPVPSYFVTGEGRSYGIDLLLKYKGSIYTSWISCAWGRSFQKYHDINYGDDIPSPYDQPVQISWTNMFSAGKWNFSTVMFYSSGKSYVDFTKENEGPKLYRLYKRLPDYFRSDLSANYNFSIKNAKFKTGVTLLNILNTQNYYDINTRKFDFENSSFSETTLIRSQSFSVNLFIHFLF